LENIAIQKVGDLDSSARHWVERLLGRPLADNEELTVVVSATRPAPPVAQRKEALERIERVLDRAAENMRDTPDAQFDAALDEALTSARRRKP
jgi:hypothetical protein